MNGDVLSAAPCDETVTRALVSCREAGIGEREERQGRARVEGGKEVGMDGWRDREMDGYRKVYSRSLD